MNRMEYRWDSAVGLQGSGGDVRTYRCNTYLGPASTSDDLSALSSSLVQHTMEGGNSSILCHGITGRQAK